MLRHRGWGLLGTAEPTILIHRAKDLGRGCGCNLLRPPLRFSPGSEEGSATACSKSQGHTPSSPSACSVVTCGSAGPWLGARAGRPLACCQPSGDVNIFSRTHGCWAGGGGGGRGAEWGSYECERYSSIGFHEVSLCREPGSVG